MEPRKRILVVSRSFYPENSPRSLRTTALVKEFARQGHSVTVLTVRNNRAHRSFEQTYAVTIKDLGALHFPSITINSRNKPYALLKRAVRRAMLVLFEYPDIELMFKVNRALKYESGYDLLISVAVPYPIHWGVAMARSDRHRIADVWVADCGDPYYGLENDSFKSLFYFAYIEKWFSRKADYISIPIEDARNAYFPEFQSKIKIIPQGLSFPKKESDSKLSPNEKVTFAYCGNIKSYLHYAIPFFERINAIDKEFRFIIYTRDREVFTQVLNPSTLRKCDIREYVEREVLLNQLQEVDFLVHFPYEKGSQKSLKLIDYAYLEKPVISYRNDSTGDQVLEEFLNGDFRNKMILEHWEKYKIEKIAVQFLGLSQPKIQQFAHRGAEYEFESK